MESINQADKSELSRFVKDTIEATENGLAGTKYYLDGKIDFELIVTTTKDAGGKFKVLVAEAGGKYEKENVSKIKFSVAKETDYIFASKI